MAPMSQLHISRAALGPEEIGPDGASPTNTEQDGTRFARDDQAKVSQTQVGPLSRIDTSWHRAGFETFHAALPAARRAADAAKLARLRQVAADVPALQEALDWADARDVTFFVDHSCEGLRGYYMPGTGVVALSDKILDYLEHGPSMLHRGEQPLAAAVGTFMHEIRHAWQDYHGMLPVPHQQSFANYVINLSLAEADATAYQNKAEVECRRAGRPARDPRPTLPAIARLEKLYGSKEDQRLWDGFTGWYSSAKPEWYGNHAAKLYGARMALDVCPVNHRLEYRFPVSIPRGPLSMVSAASVSPLGQSFDGKASYLSGAAAQVFLQERLTPSRALRFYCAARRQPIALVQEICKVEAARAQRRVQKNTPSA